MSSSFATPWTGACRAPLPVEFTRQVCWSGLPCPPPRDLPNPGIEILSPALAEDAFLLSHRGSPAALTGRYYFHLSSERCSNLPKVRREKTGMQTHSSWLQNVCFSYLTTGFASWWVLSPKTQLSQRAREKRFYYLQQVRTPGSFPKQCLLEQQNFSWVHAYSWRGLDRVCIFIKGLEQKRIQPRIGAKVARVHVLVD